MKRRILLSILSICITFSISNIAFAEIDLDLGDEPMDSSYGSTGYMKSGYVTVKGGYDMGGTIEFSGASTHEYDVSSSYSLSLEFLSMVGQNIGLGAGMTYQIPRAIDESAYDDEEFSFIPIYGVLKVFIPTQVLAPFGVLHLGYNFLFANDEFTSDGAFELEGGLYWGLGGGIMLSNGLQFELLYSVDNGKAVPEDDYLYTDVDLKYSKITISAGFNF